jgi:hypothetical protein
MQQDKAYFESKLKQLENQQLPDMSQLETHWSTMQQMLSNAPTFSPKKSMGNTTGLIAAAIMLVSLSLIVFQFNDNRKNSAEKNTAVNNAQKNNFITATPPVINNTQSSNTVSKPKKKNHNHILSATDTTNDKQDAHIFSKVLLNVIPCEICPKTTDSTGSINHAALLTDLFQQLAKEKQVFRINNSRDTLLFAKEGTVLFIPAHSFYGKDIEIGITEFYAYADMIANRLVTTSNGQQLVSGGMLHIEAKENGVTLNLASNQKIRAFVPGINSEDSMQLFYGDSNTNGGGDTISTFNNFLNWNLSGSEIISPFLKQQIRAVNLTDENAEHSLTMFNKLKGVFYRSRNAVYSRKELKEILRTKYGFIYDKIVVKNEWKKPILNFDKSSSFGDTANYSPLQIRIYQLKPIDTIYTMTNIASVNTISNQLYSRYKDSSLQKLFNSRYSIDLNQLGWINCDRFYNRKGPKSDYVIDLKDNHSNYQTFLVFDKLKSIMNGYPKGKSQIIFSKIPADEPFRIVSIGINKEGKSVIAMNEGPFNKSVIHEMKFEEADPYTMKTSLSKMNK